MKVGGLYNMTIKDTFYLIGCIGLGLLNILILIVIYQLVTERPQYYDYQPIEYSYKSFESNMTDDLFSISEGITPTTNGLHLMDEIGVLWDSIWLKCKIINIKRNGILTVESDDGRVIFYYPTTYPPKGKQIDSLNNAIKNKTIQKR